jgi:hypothetical protein
MSTKTINPFELKNIKQEEVATSALQEVKATGPNKLESTKYCPVDNKEMKRMTAGLKGSKNEIPVYVCLTHRICLPVSNDELGPEVAHV